MKVKTNLTPAELATVGDGLKKLAKAQVDSKDEIILENAAEQELIRVSDYMFDTMINSLQNEISELIRSST